MITKLALKDALALFRADRHSAFARLLRDRVIPGTGCCDVAAIDRLIAQGNAERVGSYKLPTVADLLADPFLICTIPEAAQTLGVGTRCVYYYVEQGWPHFWIGTAQIFLFSAAVEELASIVKGSVTFKEAWHVLGAEPKAVHALVEQGELQTIDPPFSRTVISRESLLRVIKARLPEWMSAQEWLDYRLQFKRQLLVAQSSVATRLCISPLDFDALVDCRLIRCIKGGVTRQSWRASPHDIEYLVQLNAIAMESRSVAALYGISPEEVSSRWPLNCSFSRHFHGIAANMGMQLCWLYKLCVSISPGFDALAWFDQRLDGTNTEPVLDLDSAAARLGRPPQQLRFMAQNGQIKAFRTPKGQWRFPESCLIV